MTDFFTALATPAAGQATTSASAAALLPVPASPILYCYRIVTDSYVRLAFGGSAVSATSASQLFAPGEVYYVPSGTVTYYSALSTTGTANYSIEVGVVGVSAR